MIWPISESDSGFIATHRSAHQSTKKRNTLTGNGLRKVYENRVFATEKFVAWNDGLNFELSMNIYSSAVRLSVYLYIFLFALLEAPRPASDHIPAQSFQPIIILRPFTM